MDGWGMWAVCGFPKQLQVEGYWEQLVGDSLEGVSLGVVQQEEESRGLVYQ